jgi:hypothetical protein
LEIYLINAPCFQLAHSKKIPYIVTPVSFALDPGGLMTRGVLPLKSILFPPPVLQPATNASGSCSVLREGNLGFPFVEGGSERHISAEGKITVAPGGSSRQG